MCVCVFPLLSYQSQESWHKELVWVNWYSVNCGQCDALLFFWSPILATLQLDLMGHWNSTRFGFLHKQRKPQSTSINLGSLQVCYHGDHAFCLSFFFWSKSSCVFLSAATRDPLISNSPTSCVSRLLLSQGREGWLLVLILLKFLSMLMVGYPKHLCKCV